MSYCTFNDLRNCLYFFIDNSDSSTTKRFNKMMFHKPTTLTEKIEHNDCLLLRNCGQTFSTIGNKKLIFNLIEKYRPKYIVSDLDRHC